MLDFGEELEAQLVSHVVDKMRAVKAKQSGVSLADHDRLADRSVAVRSVRLEERDVDFLLSNWDVSIEHVLAAFGCRIKRDCVRTGDRPYIVNVFTARKVCASLAAGHRPENDDTPARPEHGEPSRAATSSSAIDTPEHW